MIKLNLLHVLIQYLFSYFFEYYILVKPGMSRPPVGMHLVSEVACLCIGVCISAIEGKLQVIHQIFVLQIISQNIDTFVHGIVEIFSVKLSVK